MCEPWREGDGRRLLAFGGSGIIDALDDIVRGISAQAAFS
jgi:hypothetical protein